MAKALITASILVLCTISGRAQTKITNYGYPGDTTGDSLSSAGVGSRDNQLVPMQSAALSAVAAQQYGISFGQSFTAQATNGQTYNLVYADVVPTGGVNQQPAGASVIDIYNPQGSNDFETTATSVNGGPVVGVEAGLLNADSGAGSDTVQDISIPVINPMLQKFQTAAQGWAGPLIRGTTTLFWILALISFCWTGFSMLLRRTDLVEIFAELFRFIFVTGFFYWLLINGPGFAQAIIGSLRQLGGEASGTGQAIFPIQIVNLGVAVLQAQMKPINWLMPIASIIPVLLAVIVLITTILIAANVVVLLVAAWIVSFAGVVVLGFGGCRWTSDIAINFFRTALGVGLSLMVLELILGLAVSFLQSLVQQGQSGDIGQLVAITIAVVLVAIVSHRLPIMVSGMVTGSGHHNGSIGAIGLMTAVGAAMAALGIARSVAGGATGVLGNGAVSSQKLLQDRIAAGEAAMAAGNGSNGSAQANQGGAATRPSGGYSSPTAAPGASSSVYGVSIPTTGKKTATGPMATPKMPDEPPLTRPLSPDEQWELENPEFL